MDKEGWLYFGTLCEQCKLERSAGSNRHSLVHTQALTQLLVQYYIDEAAIDKVIISGETKSRI